MKKFFIFVALNILFINNSFAENYYFKTCGITEAIIANYSINFEEDVIDAKFLTSDGKSQKFKDKILLITGGTGSFGNAVLNRFLDTDIKEIRIFRNLWRLN